MEQSYVDLMCAWEIRGGVQVQACAGARVARRRAQEPGTCSLFQQFDILRMDLISSSAVCGFCLTSMKAFARAFLLLLLSHVKWLI